MSVETQAKSVSRVFLHGLIAKQAGKFVTVDFVKQDGTPRTLNGRLGVKKFLQGGVNTVMAPARSYLTVFDMKQMGYRTVDLATVSGIRAECESYKIVD